MNLHDATLETRQLVRRTGALLSGRDLAAAAAATTYFAGIALVPWLLLATWTATWPLGGAGSVAAGRERLLDLGVLVPAGMGGRPAYDLLVRAGTGMGPLTALVLLFPASFYGEGLRRGCLALLPQRDSLTGWRSRAALLPLVLVVAPLVWLLLPLTAVLVDLTGIGPAGVLLRIVLGFYGLWLALSVPVVWIFHQVAPGHLTWPVAVAGGMGTAAFLAGFLHGFLLFLALPIDVGAPFAGLGVVGGVVAVGLWLYALHTVTLVGFVTTTALQEQIAFQRADAARAAGRPGATRAPALPGRTHEHPTKALAPLTLPQGPRMSTPLVQVDVWGVDRLAPALGRMATGRLALRGTPGLRFAKLLGTGSGRTFSVRDADPGHWALVSVWDDAAAAEAFERHRVARSWSDAASERLRVRMRPVSSRGAWSRTSPFTPTDTPDPSLPVASITRARLRPSRLVRFWSAVPPVAADLHATAGLRLAVGIGEAPVGVQGTFSLWRSARDLTDFAYRRPVHTEVVRRTPVDRWYAEELFARFAVDEVVGTHEGREP